MPMLNPNGAYCMYLRKSRTDQEAELRGDGETLSRHRSILQEYADKAGITISRIYSEVISGDTIAARPQMQQLLSDVGAGMWDGVLVVEVERLARGNTRDQGLVADTFKYSDTLIITPFKTYNPNDEYDEEYFEFGLFMSRREFKTISRRLVRGRISATKEGKFAVGVAPYGYRRKKLSKDKGYILEIVPEEAAIVRQIFDWYCYGERQEDGSLQRLGLRTICTRLDAMGIKPVFRDTWSPSSIADMLKNPAYGGYVTFGRKVGRKVPTPDGSVKYKYSSPADYTIAPGLHEAIISPETFARCKEIRALNQKGTAPKPVALQNPLSGLVYCKKCGAKMHRAFSRGDAYIRCPTHGCTTVSSDVVLVEQQVLAFLRSWLDSYDLTEESAPLDNELLSLQKMLATQEKECSSVRQQLDKTYDLLEQGIYSLDEFKARQSALQTKIAAIESSMKNTNDDITNLHRIKAEKESFIPKISSLLEMYDSNSPEVNNEILKSLIFKICYEKNTRCKRGEVSETSFSLEIFPRLPK